MSKERAGFFDSTENWQAIWKGMPEFDQQDQLPWQSVWVHFATAEDREDFSKLVGQNVHHRTKYIWFPKAEIRRHADKRWVSSDADLPRYPVYVPTKGRWESAHTIKTLEKIHVPYFAVVEPQEYDQYKDVVKTGTILKLPKGICGTGTSVPARNWIMEHSIKLGAARHWQIDDNIKGFWRLTDNIKIEVETGSIFRAMEDFSDRYTNVAISGPHYYMFAPRKDKIPPLYLNTRVYSCSLVNNSIPHRWRGIYNEDTDICIRALKDEWCTVLFNAFLCYKAVTMTVKGGNEKIYKGDGRLKMAESLRDQHPDIVKVSERWGRPQHVVDYSRFKRNRLVFREGYVPPTKANEYGMSLKIDPTYYDDPAEDTEEPPRDTESEHEAERAARQEKDDRADADQPRREKKRESETQKEPRKRELERARRNTDEADEDD